MADRHAPIRILLLIENLEDRLVPSVAPAATQDKFGLTVSATADVLLASEPWSDAHSLIGLDRLREKYSYSGAGYAIAVIDTGVDYNHPALGGAFGKRVIAGYDFVANDTDPMDESGHGTVIAGIIGSDDPQYLGIAPDIDIVALRVLDSNGDGDFVNIERALRWVIDHRQQYNIVGVNLSLGAGNHTSNPYTFLEDEFQILDESNVFIAAAAGNGFYTSASVPGIGYPAISSYVVSVGAVFDADYGEVSWSSGAHEWSTAPDRMVSFSQRSDQLDILAPGAFITSTARGGGFTTLAGSSMATATITAAAALLRQAFDATGRPELARPNSILDLMRQTGVWVVDGDDEDDNVANTGLSFPRLDLFAAMRYATNVPPSVESVSDFMIAPGETLRVPISVADPQGDPVTVTASVDGAEFGAHPPVTLTLRDGVLEITPLEGFAGKVTIAITASDGIAATVETFSVVIRSDSAALPFGDAFERANLDYLGTMWLQAKGKLSVVNGSAVSQDAGASLAVISGVSATNVNAAARVNIGSTPGRLGGLLARDDGNGNGYAGLLHRLEDGSVAAQIWRIQDGLWTRLASSLVNTAEGNLRFEVVGGSLALFLDDQLAVRAQDDAITASGGIGILSWGRDVAFDDVSALASGLIAAGAAPIPFADAFDRIDSAALGSSWSERFGDFAISGGQAVSNHQLASMATLYGVSAANLSISAHVDLGGDIISMAGLVARHSGVGESDMYLGTLSRLFDGRTSAQIWRVVGGIWTLLDARFVTSSAGVLKFEVNGDRLKLTLNDRIVASAQDNMISSGEMGIRSWGRGVAFDQVVVSAESPTVRAFSETAISDRRAAMDMVIALAASENDSRGNADPFAPPAAQRLDLTGRRLASGGVYLRRLSNLSLEVRAIPEGDPEASSATHVRQTSGDVIDVLLEDGDSLSAEFMDAILQVVCEDASAANETASEAESTPQSSAQSSAESRPDSERESKDKPSAPQKSTDEQ